MSTPDSTRPVAPWPRLLFGPRDAAGLAVFRILFGLVMAWEAGRYLAYGWYRYYWVEPEFHFTYPGFDWVRPASEAGLVCVLLALHTSGLLLAAGVLSRLAALVCGLGWAYLFLLDQMTYLNHMYLICLLCLLMAVAPAHRTLSLQNLAQPGRGVDRVPAWGPGLLAVYVAVVYFFAGVAKLNPDWLRAQPMLVWLEAHRDAEPLGPLVAHDATAWILSYGGLLFDLLVGPLLLWRRSRRLVLPVVLAFHAANAFLFEIGVFPWMMMGGCVLFLDPARVRRALGALAPRLGASAVTAAAPRLPARLAVMGFLLVFGAVQLGLPLRHLAYPGDPSWTEEGHRFAWHMKLRTKAGRVRYRVEDLDTGEVRSIDPRDALSSRQYRKMRGTPDMIWLYARHLADRAAAEGRRVAVYADSQAGLNGRPYEALVDPAVDLARAPRAVWGHAEWILPMGQPLPAVGPGSDLLADLE